MEYYKDKHEIIISTNTANGFQTFSYSANIDYEIHKNFYWRVEARTLKSKDPIFEDANTMSSSSVWLPHCVDYDCI